MRRLEQSNRAIADGEADLIFTASNSFALVLTHCGLHDLAEDVLRSSIKAALKRPEPAPFWFDSFFNFVRLANRTRDRAGFLALLTVCVDALRRGDLVRLPESILELPIDLELKGNLRVLLRQHLIYEILIHDDAQARATFMQTCLDPRFDFGSAGLIFREFTIFSQGEANLQAGALYASPGGAMEGLIRALYAFEAAEREGAHTGAQEFLAMAAVLFMMLAKANKIDERCLRVVETLADQARRSGRDDVRTLVLDAGLNVVGEDWYMGAYFTALKTGAAIKPIGETYACIRPALADLARRWAPLAA